MQDRRNAVSPVVLASRFLACTHLRFLGFRVVTLAAFVLVVASSGKLLEISSLPSPSCGFFNFYGWLFTTFTTLSTFSTLAMRVSIKRTAEKA